MTENFKIYWNSFARTVGQNRTLFSPLFNGRVWLRDSHVESFYHPEKLNLKEKKKPWVVVWLCTQDKIYW